MHLKAGFWMDQSITALAQDASYPILGTKNPEFLGSGVVFGVFGRFSQLDTIRECGAEYIHVQVRREPCTISIPRRKSDNSHHLRIRHIILCYRSHTITDLARTVLLVASCLHLRKLCKVPKQGLTRIWRTGIPNSCHSSDD